MAGENPKLRRSSKIRKVIWITALTLLAAWAAPRVVRVNFWQREVAAALSGALHRPVRVGDIHLRVLGGLGVEVANVAVDEDPAFGVEPFARAESVEARVALSSLWHGRVEFSSINLISPSFNVVRNAAGHWNLESLASESFVSGNHDPAAVEDEAATWVLPRVRVESGRINFKSGDRKKAYRIEALQLELMPQASPRQPWRFQLEGMPARTDLPFQPTSVFQASGEFGPVISGLPKDAGIPLHLDWSAENAMLAELLTIVTGKEMGVHGVFSLHGHAAGTTSLFRISADGKIDDLHRWDLLPAPEAASMRAELAGIVDLSTEALELTSLRIPLGSGSAILRGRVEDIFNHPQPKLEAELRQVPLSSLAAMVPQFTARIAPGLLAEGSLQGSIRSEGLSGAMVGTVEVSPGFVQLSESSPRLRFSSFPVVLDGTKGRLGPVRAEPGQGGPAQVSVQWDAAKHSSEWQLRGERISISAALHLASDFGLGSNVAKLPKGNLALRLDIATNPGELPRLAGWAQISSAVVEPRWLSQPLRIASARLQFQRNQWKIQPLSAELGPVGLEGSIAIKFPVGRAPAGASHAASPAVEFELEAPRIDIAELAALFAPPPPEESFFGFGKDEAPAATPLDAQLGSILESLQVRGILRADSLRYRGIALEDVKASVYLHDRQMEIPDFSAQHAGGTEQGTAALYFAQGPFTFTLDSRYANLDIERLTESSEQWRGAVSGNLSGVLHLASSGRTLEELVSQMNGSGEANGARVILRDARWAEALDSSDTSESHIASFTTTFQIRRKLIQVPEMKVILTNSAGVGDDRTGRPAQWWLSGDVGFDQRLDFLAQEEPGGGESHWAGTLSDPQITRHITSGTTAKTRTDASLPSK